MNINVQAHQNFILNTLSRPAETVEASQSVRTDFSVFVFHADWLALPPIERITFYSTLIPLILEKENATHVVKLLRLLSKTCTGAEPSQLFQLFYDSDYSFQLRDILQTAARYDNAQMVKYLLSLAPMTTEQLSDFLNKVDPNVGLEDTIFIEAARIGNIGILEILLELLGYEADVEEYPLAVQKQWVDSLNRPNAQGQTAFTEAARNDHQNILELIAKIVSDNILLSELLMHHDKENKTALMYEEEMDEQGELNALRYPAYQIIQDAIMNQDNNRAIKLIQSLGLKTKYFFAKEPLVGNTYKLLRMAVEHRQGSRGPLIVAIILENLALKEKLTLLAEEDFEDSLTALMAAETLGDPDVAGYLRMEITQVLSPKNKLLLESVEQGDLDTVELCFNAAASIDNNFKAEMRTHLLLQQDAQGRTALQKAIENNEELIIDYLREVAADCLFFLVDTPRMPINYKVPLIIALLKSLPVDIKFSILTKQYRVGTIPMMVVAGNYLSVMPFIFENFDAQDINTVLNMRNRNGFRMMDVANTIRFAPMIAFLNEVNPQSLNPAQSTHNRIVHDTTARSAVHLMAEYVVLSLEDKSILQAWANSKNNATDDRFKKEAMQQVLLKPQTQAAFAALVHNTLPAIDQWAQALSSMGHKQAAAFRGYYKIMKHPEFVSYKEGQTLIGLAQLLCLIWRAIHDEVDHARNEAMRYVDFATRCENGREALMLHLFEATRDKNLVNGEDLHPFNNTPDTEDRSKCQDGFFNNLVGVSISLKPETNINYVQRTTVKLKAFCLMYELFDSSDYGLVLLTDLNTSLEEDNLLSEAVKQKLAPAIMAQLQIEFSPFIESGALKQADIDDALEAALNLQGEDSYRVVMKITEKIAKDARMSAFGVQAEEAQTQASSSVALQDAPPQTIVAAQEPAAENLAIPPQNGIPSQNALSANALEPSENQADNNTNNTSNTSNTTNASNSSPRTIGGAAKRKRSPSPR